MGPALVNSTSDKSKTDISKIALKIAKKEELPLFKKKLQEAFAVAVIEKYGSKDGLVPPDESIEKSFNKHGAAVYHVLYNDIIIGGVVVVIDDKTQNNSLDLFFISPQYHSLGLGYAVWKAIEAMYPETCVWETATPYFEKRNINFYVNKCGFHIVEFFNEHHPDPHRGAHDDDSPHLHDEGFFRFEKIMK